MCGRGWRANCQCTAQALTLRCCSSDRRESRWWVRDKASTPPLSWGRWHTHAHTPATAGPPVDRRHYPAPLPQWRGLAQDHTVDKMRDMYWWESAVLTWQLPLCITRFDASGQLDTTKPTRLMGGEESGNAPGHYRQRAGRTAQGGAVPWGCHCLPCLLQSGSGAYGPSGEMPAQQTIVVE
jgi:hypothetical protein